MRLLACMSELLKRILVSARRHHARRRSAWRVCCLMTRFALESAIRCPAGYV